MRGYLWTAKPAKVRKDTAEFCIRDLSVRSATLDRAVNALKAFDEFKATQHRVQFRTPSSFCTKREQPGCDRRDDRRRDGYDLQEHF